MILFIKAKKREGNVTGIQALTRKCALWVRAYTANVVVDTELGAILEQVNTNTSLKITKAFRKM